VTTAPEKVVIGNAELWLGDCRDVLPMLPMVDLVLTDPPFFGVKDEAWDNQWPSADAFLAFIGDVVGLLADKMRSNASMYLFASPAMAARVESETSKRLNVLNHICWRKAAPGKKAISAGNKSEKEALRAYWPGTERIIFAEHFNSDNLAKGKSSYTAKCDELRGFVFEPLRAYLAGECAALGWTAGDVNRICGNKMATHYLTNSQWTLPTEANYKRMQEAAHGHIRREYEDLRREYEDLRREYEDLRREYEDLRRPFALTNKDQWSDCWEFDPVPGYAGKHPCEKPVPLLSQAILASSRPGALVLDAFMGSGSSGDACALLGRRYIGIEKDKAIFRQACERIENAHAQQSLFDAVRAQPAMTVQKQMFA